MKRRSSIVWAFRYFTNERLEHENFANAIGSYQKVLGGRGCGCVGACPGGFSDSAVPNAMAFTSAASPALGAQP